jgi:PAS domain S-box-containing protein
MASLVNPDDADSGEVEQTPASGVTRLPPDVLARHGDLVANAGHELKTPLSIILGLSGRLLAATAGDAGQQRDVERIRSNAYVLLKQVDDLLQAARIDDGRATVQLTDCDVAALVRETAIGFQSLLDERGQRLVLRTPGRLAARVDEPKLATVLSNLVANAVRYAPAGGVVRCALATEDGELRLEVADSGPGIPPAERMAVFERFHQIGGTAHVRPGGTGLGLAIVRELVTLMGGTVVAGEAPEGGALFTVAVPYEHARATPAGVRRRFIIDPAERERATIEALKLELEALERRRLGAHRPAAADPLPRVLLAEPSATLGQYLDELLSADYEVHRATTAGEALRIAAQTEIEAVIVDVETAQGEALLRAVRTGALEALPLVVLAGDPEQAQALVRDRAVDYVIKPFAEALLVRLGAIVGRRRAETARAAADARFRAVFEHAPTGMALATPDGRLLDVNAALARMLGLTRGAPLDLGLDDLTHPHDLLDGPRSLVPDAGDAAVQRIERRLVAADGRVLHAVLTISVIREGAAPRQLVVQVEQGEPREREAAEALLRALAAQLARCQRYDELAALLVVEVPELVAGDDAMRRRTAAAVAGTIRRRLRRSDPIVPLGDCRLAAIIVNADVAAAEAVARDVERTVAAIAVDGDGRLHPRVGVCAFDAGASAPRILARAEGALDERRPGERRVARG